MKGVIMPRRGDVFLQGNYYHIYNRGLNGEVIFLAKANYVYCLKIIKRNLSRYKVKLIAYCLMPNHYHFLLRQESTIPLMKFINSTFISYVQALNKELKRSGPLFDGRYKHVLVDREEYILHLCRYIHLNSVKAGLVSKPEDWPFSNYLEWINRQSGTLKDETFIKERFPISGEYEEFVNECQLGEETRLLIGDYLLD
jgi:putative transposase